MTTLEATALRFLPSQIRQILSGMKPTREGGLTRCRHLRDGYMTLGPNGRLQSSGHRPRRNREAGDPARAVRFTDEPETVANVAVGGSPAPERKEFRGMSGSCPARGIRLDSDAYTEELMAERGRTSRSDDLLPRIELGWEALHMKDG